MQTFVHQLGGLLLPTGHACRDEAGAISYLMGRSNYNSDVGLLTTGNSGIFRGQDSGPTSVVPWSSQGSLITFESLTDHYIVWAVT